MSDTMQEDHERDYRRKAKIDKLRMEIERFLADEDKNVVSALTEGRLIQAYDGLTSESYNIVKRWD